jgi:hypothetical protein
VRAITLWGPWVRSLGFREEVRLGVFLDTVLMCAVSDSKQAGMIVGFKLLEKKYIAADPHFVF